MSELPRCRNCKHWLPPAQRTDFKNLWKGQEADRQYGECRAVGLADSYEDAPDPLPLAVTKDASDYRADLFTQPEFGCVLFEQKET